MTANLATHIVEGARRMAFHDVSSSDFKGCLGEITVSLAQACFEYVFANAASLIRESRITLPMSISSWTVPLVQNYRGFGVQNRRDCCQRRLTPVGLGERWVGTERAGVRAEDAWR